MGAGDSGWRECDEASLDRLAANGLEEPRQLRQHASTMIATTSIEVILIAQVFLYLWIAHSGSLSSNTAVGMRSNGQKTLEPLFEHGSFIVLSLNFYHHFSLQSPSTTTIYPGNLNPKHPSNPLIAPCLVPLTPHLCIGPYPLTCGSSTSIHVLLNCGPSPGSMLKK
jgi:hypothetical protein